jgi:hypothetical protein
MGVEDVLAEPCVRCSERGLCERQLCNLLEAISVDSEDCLSGQQKVLDPEHAYNVSRYRDTALARCLNIVLL